METDRALDSAQKVSMVIDALQAGALKVREQDEAWVRELLAVRRGVTGLVDITSLAPETIARARATALALAFFGQEEQEEAGPTALGLQDAQCELFRLFEELFVGLTGVGSASVASEAEIKARMLDRVRSRNDDIFDDFNATAGELVQFYQQNAAAAVTFFRTVG